MVNYIYVKGKGNLCVELAEYIHLLDGIDVWQRVQQQKK